ncbi:S-acyl fatty acid synthase thioesterase, medium chain [Stylophora pistillata]|uniref:oleoyl-[acyl-carrier-protein] hydrolase n=1 Tax=Stylophora pistillata TaxID=50429 RepID=A0A2B4STJ6_STYPI|nr:S-acyl fatty acid synthase thioesterase, medium chain [Stylophora pistillata]
MAVARRATKAQDMNSKWLHCVYQKHNAKLRLICFPWAGGGAAFCANWGKKFTSEIEVHGVCLPGKLFAFWGHSLGTRLCFETARYLKLNYNMQPVHLLISSATAPQVSEKSKYGSMCLADSVAKVALDVSTLSDDDLIKKISSWGGTPKALTENRDMMRIAACVFRADLTLQQNYRFEESATNVAIDCPLTCFDGSGDLHDQDAGFDQTDKAEYNEQNTGQYFRYLVEEVLKNVSSEILETHQTMSLQ